MSDENKPAWVENNKIDNTALENFKKEAEVNQCPPLAIAIENGFIDEEKFLDKEQAKSDLAIINKDYFNTNPAGDLFNGYDYLAFKKEGIIPLAKWEEHSYFAKISSDKANLESTLVNAIFVLAPWTGLKKWFQFWEKNQKPKEEKKEILEGIKKVSQDTLNKINFGDIKLPPIPTALNKKKLETTNPQIIKQEAPKPPPVPTDLNATIIDPFEKWCGYFEKSLLFSVNGNELKLLKSNGKWSISNTLTLKVEKAGMFKIVLDTQKSYHGFVNPSETNKSFFDIANQGILTEHVTLCPVIENQNITGLYLGCTTKEKALNLRLSTLEDIVKSTLTTTTLKRAA
ncbi:MAG: hypothetical protein IPM57_08105 [Oligoflexia bacterium]|nr:hypothetical protein [Oligoflexia bacterium]